MSHRYIQSTARVSEPCVWIPKGTSVEQGTKLTQFTWHLQMCCVIYSEWYELARTMTATTTTSRTLRKRYQMLQLSQHTMTSFTLNVTLYGWVPMFTIW